MKTALFLVAVLSPLPALAQPPAVPPQEQPLLREIAARVQPENLHATLEKLVSFGTRHTLSDTRSARRGIGAARGWVKAQFERISRECGGCLEIITPARMFTGPRLPKAGAEVMDIVAIQKGTSDPGRYLVMTAHLDSRVSDIMNANAFEPGADDDGSGIAALIETARILSHYRFPATIVYSADSGEEQGLYGGRIIADYARDHHWRVEADLNDDMVGNAVGSDGIADNTTGRIFSESLKQGLTEKELDELRYTGGFEDSPSREVARYIARLTQQYLPDFHLMLMYRQDRFHRGGDQMAFNQNGFPAVRLTEAHENWAHQHQDVRVENGVQYGDLVRFVSIPYLAKMTAVDAISLAALAWAPAPPTGVAIHSELSPDTTLTWQAVPGAAGYRLYWRRTDAAQWQHSMYVGQVTSYTLKNLVIDNWFFGVASVSPEGFESPAVYPGPGGAF